MKQRRSKEKVSGEILLKIGYTGNINQEIDCDLARRQTRIYGKFIKYKVIFYYKFHAFIENI